MLHRRVVASLSLSRRKANHEQEQNRISRTFAISRKRALPITPRTTRKASDRSIDLRSALEFCAAKPSPAQPEAAVQEALVPPIAISLAHSLSPLLVLVAKVQHTRHELSRELLPFHLTASRPLSFFARVCHSHPRLLAVTMAKGEGELLGQPLRPSDLLGFVADGAATATTSTSTSAPKPAPDATPSPTALPPLVTQSERNAPPSIALPPLPSLPAMLPVPRREVLLAPAPTSSPLPPLRFNSLLGKQPLRPAVPGPLNAILDASLQVGCAPLSSPSTRCHSLARSLTRCTTAGPAHTSASWPPVAGRWTPASSGAAGIARRVQPQRVLDWL